MSRSARLQFLATMLYRFANTRGGRTRSFANGSNTRGRGQFVTGDSHLRSVRQGSFSNQPLQQPPPSNQNQQFGYPRPSFYQNQAVRSHRRKPLDYRAWEYAKVPPPPNSERFLILSYKLLADYLAIDHRGKLYHHIPRHMLDWEWRKRSIIFELGLWSAEVMCFQVINLLLREDHPIFALFSYAF